MKKKIFLPLILLGTLVAGCHHQTDMEQSTSFRREIHIAPDTVYVNTGRVVVDALSSGPQAGRLPGFAGYEPFMQMADAARYNRGQLLQHFQRYHIDTVQVRGRKILSFEGGYLIDTDTLSRFGLIYYELGRKPFQLSVDDMMKYQKTPFAGLSPQPAKYFVPVGASVSTQIPLRLGDGKYLLMVFLSEDIYENSDRAVRTFTFVQQQKEGLYIEYASNHALVVSLGENCPADGYTGVSAGNGRFTIEQTYCREDLFALSRMTFTAADSSDILLDRYEESYMDRENPSRIIPEKSLTVRDFGRISFMDVDINFLLEKLH